LFMGMCQAEGWEELPAPRGAPLPHTVEGTATPLLLL